MQELNKLEMMEIDGGIEITSALIAALVKTAEISFELGQSVGSALRATLGRCIA